MNHALITKPIPLKYFSQNQQGRFCGFQFSVDSLNWFKVSYSFISSRIGEENLDTLQSLELEHSCCGFCQSKSVGDTFHGCALFCYYSDCEASRLRVSLNLVLILLKFSFIQRS